MTKASDWVILSCSAINSRFSLKNSASLCSLLNVSVSCAVAEKEPKKRIKISFTTLGCSILLSCFLLSEAKIAGNHLKKNLKRIKFSLMENAVRQHFDGR